MRFNSTLLAGSLSLSLIGCAGTMGEEDGGKGPTLLALTRTEVSVGQAVEIIGQDYLDGDAGHTEVVLEGEYHTDGGQVYAVEERVRPHWGSATRLIWANVGPWRVPFSPTGDELGTFHGTMTGINVEPDGTESRSDPMPIDLRIAPSVIVRDLQPIGGECEEPAKRLIGGFPYRISVEAIGIEPVSFTYELLNEPGTDGRPRVFRQPVTSNKATFGENGELFTMPVPDGDVFYFNELLITARDAEGNQAAAIFAFGVHRPVEYIDWGKPQIAEIEQPQPAGGCIAGGINGQEVSYEETETDSRSRQVSYNWNEDWREEHSGQYSTSHEERNGINTSYTETEETGWSTEWSRSDSFSAGGSVSINPLGFLGGSASAEWGSTQTVGGNEHWSRSTGYTVGRDYSEADTESWAYTNSESYGVSKGGGEFWEVSSSNSVTSRVSASIIPSMYGVWYRQATRIIRPGTVVAYNLCGQPMVAAEANFEDYVWAVSLSQDSECPPLPESSLPKAECVIAPCGSGQ